MNAVGVKCVLKELAIKDWDTQDKRHGTILKLFGNVTRLPIDSKAATRQASAYLKFFG